MCLARNPAQDPELVEDLISRKRKEKLVQKDPNFPDRQDLELYRCWDAQEWEQEDVGAEEFEVQTKVDADKHAVSKLVNAHVFRPETTKEDQGIKPPENKPGSKRARKGGREKSEPPAAAPLARSDVQPGAELKAARQAAVKTLKELGSLLVDSSSWESRLKAANVPQPMVAAIAAAGIKWHETITQLRMDLESVLIQAINQGDPLPLQTVLTRAADLTKTYHAESVTTKRLMAPGPKTRGRKG